MQSILYAILGMLLAAIAIIEYLKVVYNHLRTVSIPAPSRSAGKTSTTVSDDTNSKNDENAAVKDNIEMMKYAQAPGPFPLPILGNLHLLSRYAVPFQAFTALAKKYGDIYSLTLGSQRCLIVNNLELIQEVLNKNGKFFGGRPDFLRFHLLFGGDRSNSLALCDWSNLQQKRRYLARRYCSPRFGTSLYEVMSKIGCYEMQAFYDHINPLIKEGNEIELKPILQKTCGNMFLHYMSSVRFEYDHKDFETMVEHFDEIFWEINQGYAMDFIPWLSIFSVRHTNRLKNWSKDIRKFILDHIINKREQNLDVPSEKSFSDFVELLQQNLKEDKQEGITEDTILYMLEDFIGGHSAVGNVVMLTLAFTVLHPDVGRKIHDEIDEFLDGNTENFITLMDMDSLPYTRGTIFEVLRYGSSPIVPHVATEDVQVGGYGVTKGTTVFINNYELNTSSKYWDHPEQFQPERFLETVNASNTGDATGNGKPVVQLKKRIPHFLPFSIGQRTCIGQNLMKNLGFLTLANVMRVYNVRCLDKTKLKIYPACVALPAKTFSLILEPRRK